MTEVDVYREIVKEIVEDTPGLSPEELLEEADSRWEERGFDPDDLELVTDALSGPAGYAYGYVDVTNAHRHN